MSAPALSTVHIDQALTMILIAYMNPSEHFVWNRALPQVPIANRSAKYHEFDKADLLRVQAQFRAEGAAAARSGWAVSNTTTTTERVALAHGVPDPVRVNADFDYDRAATEFIAHQMMLKVENKFNATIFTTSTWTGSSTGSDLTASPTWDDASSTPIEDIRLQIQTLQEVNAIAGGTFKLIFGCQTYNKLLDHPDIIDRIKYGQTAGGPAMANANILAQLFGVGEVLVGKATENTAIEGVAESMDFVLEQKKALLISVPASPTPFTPSAGYTFVWNEGDKANGVEGVKRYRDEVHESDVFEGGFWFDHKVVAGAMGAFWTSAVA